jgi:hypothetical protein
MLGGNLISSMRNKFNRGNKNTLKGSLEKDISLLRVNNDCITLNIIGFGSPSKRLALERLVELHGPDVILLKKLWVRVKSL